MSIFDIIRHCAESVAKATEVATTAVADAATTAAKETAYVAVETAKTTYDTAKAVAEAQDAMHKAAIEAIKTVSAPIIQKTYGDDGVKKAGELLDKLSSK